MHNLSWSTPYEEEVKTITLKRDPFYYGLGNYEDIDGTLWDVHAVLGFGNRPYIQARPVDDHYLYDTSRFGEGYSCSWQPYFVKMVSKDLIKIKSAYESHN